jgi:hypothetical protein
MPSFHQLLNANSAVNRTAAGSESVSESHQLVAVCPIFGFQISEVLYGHHSEEKSRQYFKMLFEKFSEGIPLSAQVKLRRINKDDYDQLKTTTDLLTLQ